MAEALTVRALTRVLMSEAALLTVISDKSLVPQLLKKLSESGNLKQDDITYVTHRM